MKHSPSSPERFKERPRHTVINTIADIFKIWKTGRLYMLPDQEKRKAKEMVLAELEKKTLTNAQLNTMATLRNVLEG